MAAATKVPKAVANANFVQLRNFTSCLKRCSPMINFPERPTIPERYAGLEAVKNMKIPTQATPSPSSSMQTTKSMLQFQMPVSNQPFKEERYTKSDGVSVFVTDKLPLKYKRPVLSEEEIEYIMRGGPDL